MAHKLKWLSYGLSQMINKAHNSKNKCYPCAILGLHITNIETTTHFLFGTTYRVWCELNVPVSEEILWCYDDHFVYAPSQWETTLQCNVVSRWLGVHTKWSLVIVILTMVWHKDNVDAMLQTTFSDPVHQHSDHVIHTGQICIDLDGRKRQIIVEITLN